MSDVINSNHIANIEIDQNGECLFYFYNSEQPMYFHEFEYGSPTRIALEMISELIYVWNNTEKE